MTKYDYLINFKSSKLFFASNYFQICLFFLE